jgi:1-acyl-sn-glycerol-3-phosphate acyltransferase
VPTVLRFPLLVVYLFTATPVCVGIQWILTKTKRPGGSALWSRYFRLINKMLRVRIEVIGERAPGPVLVVSNHVSWLDVMVIGAVTPVVFVAKREVGTWPVVGPASKAQRAVFVDRGRRQQTAYAIAEIAERLSRGNAVLLFAEGTSSDGNRVLPFRSALIGAVNEAISRLGPERPVAVQPLSVCYVRHHGVAMGRQHRPLVAWYGDLDFVPHLWTFMRHCAVDVVLTFGEPAHFDTRADRKTTVKALEAQVRHLTVSTLRGRPEPLPGAGAREPVAGPEPAA